MKDCPDRKVLGERIQQLRKGAGYKSAKAFSEMAGVGYNAYVECEQGRSRLSYENAWKIADALHISLDELGGRTWPPGMAADAGESQLLEAYRDLNEEGRDAAVNVVAGMRLAYPPQADQPGLGQKEA